MDFIDQLKQFSTRVQTLKENIQTEEATKTAIIMPFFSMLGYDVFNPQEFVPEYIADVGIKKGEKVDYAILNNGEPVVLIECKSIQENLEKHDSQLFRYFATTSAKFAILTNGIEYKFYTDLDSQNVMDSDPFMVIDILNIRENQVLELKKFCKPSFDIESISSRASELKYSNEFKDFFATQLDEPSDDFVRLFLQRCYQGNKNQNVLDRFRPILRKSLNTYINEKMNDRLNAALGGDGGRVAVKPEETLDNKKGAETAEEVTPPKKASKIVTTEEELEGYFIVKMILSSIVDIHDITYKDTESYFNVLYKGNTRKWICRLKLTGNQKLLIIPDENKKDTKYPLEDIYQIKEYESELKIVLNRYIK